MYEAVAKWLDTYRERRKQAKILEEKLREDKYLDRLRRTVSGYGGYTCYGVGPFLDIDEVQDILRAELDRRTEELTGD